MPLYNYRCTACAHAFETLVMGGDVPVCPQCGSQALERQIGGLAPASKLAPIIKEGRAQAAREGHFSNYSKAELSKKR
jgi:putative FmdB family regulatory protein